MEHVHYSVVATLPNKILLSKYLDWLQNGHMQAVLQAGALRAQAIQLEPLDGLHRVRTLYQFQDTPAFEAYVRDHAPRLRAEGLELFGPQTGTKFDRERGVICHELGQIARP